MKNTAVPSFYRNKPIFGFDIGSDTIKVAQLSADSTEVVSKNSKPKLIGYGYTRFDNSAIDDGVIIKPEIIAETAKKMLDNGISGRITTNRVAMAIPANKTISRSIKIPKLSNKQIQEAVELEAEQYIPTGTSELYIDYEIVRETLSNELEINLIAVPKKIVDSYMQVAKMLNLEVILIEPTLNSASRLFSIDKHSKSTAILIDFGALSSDISIFDRHVIVSGTVEGGGVNFTDLIRRVLKVPVEEAEIAKTRYGISPSNKQQEIKKAIEPILQKIIQEIKRMIRYYEERYGSDKPIKQIVTLGGGANMPGLSEYLTDNMRMAVRHGDPWQFIDTKKIKAPKTAEKSMYSNALGLALVDSKGIYKS